MRRITGALAIAAAAALLPEAVRAQAILSYGLAAGAGATAGTAAGKAVSDSIDVILGKTGKTLEKAAGNGKAGDTAGLTEQQILELKQKQQREAEQLRREREAAARKLKERAALARAALAQPLTLPPPSMLGAIWNIRLENVAPSMASTLPEVTPEALSAIASGATREQVLGNFGTPAARVVIPDGNRINEVYYYQSGGSTVGAVRMSEGSVTGVVVNAN